MLRVVNVRPRHVAALALSGLTLALVLSCKPSDDCLFSSGQCGSHEQLVAPAPALTFGPTDPTLDGGCDDSIRRVPTSGDLDAGDALLAPPGTGCSAPSDCAPVFCTCIDGGALPPGDDDAGDAGRDAADGGDADAAPTSRSVGVRACVCSTRACATPPEACALGTRFGACSQPTSP